MKLPMPTGCPEFIPGIFILGDGTFSDRFTPLLSRGNMNSTINADGEVIIIYLQYSFHKYLQFPTIFIQR